MALKTDIANLKTLRANLITEIIAFNAQQVALAAQMDALLASIGTDISTFKPNYSEAGPMGSQSVSWGDLETGLIQDQVSLLESKRKLLLDATALKQAQLKDLNELLVTLEPYFLISRGTW